jgi:hypothetical protein
MHVENELVGGERAGRFSKRKMLMVSLKILDWKTGE